MHRKQNWDDLRYVLAVARTGSVSAAGRELGVNHATVLRRVAAFETAFGLTLFDKTVRGYRVSPGNQAVLDALSETEDAVLGVLRAASGKSAPLSGTVRVTSTDTFCATVLPRIARDLAAVAPDLRLELISSNLHLNFARLDADLTVRPSPKLPDEMEGETVGDLGFGVYAAHDYRGDRWVGLTGALSRIAAAEWIAANVPASAILAGSDSFMTARELVALGRGRSFLPDILASRDRRLVRLADAAPRFATPIWVAWHRDMRNVPRLRRARQMLCAALSGHAETLAGVDAPG